MTEAQALADALDNVLVRVVITEKEMIRSPLNRSEYVHERLTKAGVPIAPVAGRPPSLFNPRRGRIDVRPLRDKSGEAYGLEYTWLA